MAEMTRNMRELNLKIFEKKAGGKILFQPRIEWWYQWNKTRGTLPEKYKNMSLLEVFDDLGVSIRYYEYYTGLPLTVGVKYNGKVKMKERIKGKNDREILPDNVYPTVTGLPFDMIEEKKEGERTIIISTPKGEMVQKEKLSSDGNWRTTEFPIKTAEDIEKAEWLFRNTSFVFIKDNFERGSEFVEDRGEPQFFLPRSPYQNLSLYWMGTEGLIYALADVPDKVERLMRAMDDSYNILYEDIISYGKVKIVNFGENIDANIISPHYFEKYCIPFYEKRSKKLQESGIYTHIHIDGSFKALLKYLKDLPFDGLEALTSYPQGDVSIEEMREAIGDKVLLDGIPAIMFLSDYPLKKFKSFVEKVMELFCPRLILGASDEVPPPADIKRVAYVSEVIRKVNKGFQKA